MHSHDLYNNMKLSVFVVTYNQEKYIRQCLDSILMQKVDFDYEIVIGEDHGTDNTRAICEEYAEKYPHIRLLPLKERLGIAENWKRVLGECKGKYIALCEGDDYWIDPMKLQKQVDFLDTHNNIGYLFTRHLRMRPNGEIYDFFKSKDILIPETMDLDYLLRNELMPTTQTVCFKSSLLPTPLPQFMKGHLYADLILLVVIASKSDVGYIDDATAVYREGIGMMTLSRRKCVLKSLFYVYEHLNRYTHGKYDYIFGNKAKQYHILYNTFRPHRSHYIRAYYYYIVWQILEKGFTTKNIMAILKNTFRKFNKITNR